MIIVDVLGGLGNQMFQYAMARAVAERLNQPLLVDISGFGKYQLHNGFELMRVFSKQQEVASLESVRKVLDWQSLPVVKRLMLRPELTFLRNEHYIVEPHFQYWNGIKKTPKNSYITGYWQSEKYFISIESVIRNDFTFKSPMSNDNQKVSIEIEQCNSVSLHVRRGDYISSSSNVATHGLCSLDYYEKAIKHITERVINPKLFIFSDDIEWVKSNLNIDYPCHYVDHNHESESYNDMRLMSLCQHNIIANSSFSWWGAWLNDNHEKVVIAPKRWFKNQTDTQDLIPSNWILI